MGLRIMQVLLLPAYQPAGHALAGASAVGLRPPSGAVRQQRKGSSLSLGSSWAPAVVWPCVLQ